MNSRGSGGTETQRFGTVFFWMMIAAVVWAAIETIGTLVPVGYSACQVVWTRYGTHLLLMLLFSGPALRRELRKPHSFKLHCSRSLLLLGMPLFFIAGVRYMPVNTLWTIFWISPVLVAVLAWSLLNEPLQMRHSIILGAGVLGTLLLLGPVELTFRKSMIFPVGMAVCFSLYIVMTRKLRNDGIWINLLYPAAGIFLLLSLALPLYWKRPTLHALIPMLAIGALGWVELYAIQKALTMSFAAPACGFFYMQHVWSVVAFMVLQKQSVTNRSMASGVPSCSCSRTNR